MIEVALGEGMAKPQEYQAVCSTWCDQHQYLQDHIPLYSVGHAFLDLLYLY